MESVRMILFQQMYQFVYHHIFEAFHRLLGKLKIDPYPAFFNIAGSPLGLHVFDAELICMNACLFLASDYYGLKHTL